MKETKYSDVEMLTKPRLKLTERDCPRCHSVIIKNTKEECYECTNCGYIDCGED